MPVTFILSPFDTQKLLQFIYVNGTFFKAKRSTSSFYITACDKSTNENKPIFHVFPFSLTLPELSPLQGQEQSRAHAFIICI